MASRHGGGNLCSGSVTTAHRLDQARSKAVSTRLRPPCIARYWAVSARATIESTVAERPPPTTTPAFTEQPCKVSPPPGHSMVVGMIDGMKKRGRATFTSCPVNRMEYAFSDFGDQKRPQKHPTRMSLPDSAGVRPPMPNPAPDRVNASHQGGSHENSSGCRHFPPRSDGHVTRLDGHGRWLQLKLLCK